MKVKTAILREMLPALTKCYGFKVHEINGELTETYDKQVQEERHNKELAKEYSYEQDGHSCIKVADYVLSTDDAIEIAVSNNFRDIGDKIATMCKNYFGDNIEEYKTCARIMIFMAAILNRDENGLRTYSEVDEIDWQNDTYIRNIRPDLLQLYIARHEKCRNQYHPYCTIKFGCSGKYIEVQSGFPWFEKVLDRYLHKFLKVGSVEEAKKELQEIYGKKAGRTLNKTTARYIWGAYHLLQGYSSIQSRTKNTATRKQSRIILDYLHILGLENSTETEAESIRGRINNLLKKYDSIEEFLEEQQYKNIPNDDYQELFLNTVSISL